MQGLLICQNSFESHRKRKTVQALGLRSYPLDFLYSRSRGACTKSLLADVVFKLVDAATQPPLLLLHQSLALLSGFTQ